MIHINVGLPTSIGVTGESIVQGCQNAIAFTVPGGGSFSITPLRVRHRYQMSVQETINVADATGYTSKFVTDQGLSDAPRYLHTVEFSIIFESYEQASSVLPALAAARATFEGATGYVTNVPYPKLWQETWFTISLPAVSSAGSADALLECTKAEGGKFDKTIMQRPGLVDFPFYTKFNKTVTFTTTDLPPLTYNGWYCESLVYERGQLGTVTYKDPHTTCAYNDPE